MEIGINDCNFRFIKRTGIQAEREAMYFIVSQVQAIFQSVRKNYNDFNVCVFINIRLGFHSFYSCHNITFYDLFYHRRCFCILSVFTDYVHSLLLFNRNN